MSTDDTHFAALEKNATVTTQDIINKIDEINSKLNEIIKDHEQYVKDIKICRDGINQRPTSMEEKSNKRFKQFDQRFK